jgi:hypothetical protein
MGAYLSKTTNYNYTKTRKEEPLQPSLETHHPLPSNVPASPELPLHNTRTR